MGCSDFFLRKYNNGLISVQNSTKSVKTHSPQKKINAKRHQSNLR